MAITKCPECGKKISTTVSQCIHCGCEVSICPDCNQAYIGRVPCCTECGYSFNGTTAEYAAKSETTNNLTDTESKNNEEVPSEVKNSEEKSPEVENTVDATEAVKPLNEMIAQWRKKHFPFFYHVFNIFGYIAIANAIIAIGLALLSLLINAIAGGEDDIIYISACFVNAFLSFAIANVYDCIADLCVAGGIKKWAKQNNIELLPILDSALSFNTSKLGFWENKKITSNILHTFDAVYFYTPNASKFRELIIAIIDFFLTGISAIFVAIFLIMNIGHLASDPFDLLGYDSIWLIIIAAIAIIIEKIVTKSLSKKADVARRSWAKENLTKNAYTGYVSRRPRA